MSGTSRQAGYLDGLFRAQQQCLQALVSPEVDPPVRMRFGFRSGLRPSIRAAYEDGCAGQNPGLGYLDGVCAGYETVLRRLEGSLPATLARNDHDQQVLARSLSRLRDEIQRRYDGDRDLVAVVPNAAEVHLAVESHPRPGWDHGHGSHR